MSPRATSVDVMQDLTVALEGQCEWLGLSVVGSEVFAHDGSGAIIRLTGAAPTRLPFVMLDDPDGTPAVTPVARLWGRWPDRLYASYESYETLYLPDALTHLAGDTWVDVPGFGAGNTIRCVEAWTEGRAVAQVFVPTGEPLDGQLRAIGGEPTSMAILADGCDEDWSASKPTLDRMGNLGIAWSCGDADHFAIWPAGEAAPISHALPVPFDYGPFGVLPDTRGGFYTSYRSGRILHVDQDGARVVQPPIRRFLLQHLGTGPNGRLWVAMRNQVFVQSERGRGWTRQRIRGRAPLEQMAGTEVGIPIVRRGGTYYGHGYQYRHDEKLWTRRADGRWSLVPPIPSTVDPERRLHPDFLYADLSGHLWMTAHAEPTGSEADTVTDWAVITTHPMAQTLPCPAQFEG